MDAVRPPLKWVLPTEEEIVLARLAGRFFTTEELLGLGLYPWGWPAPTVWQTSIGEVVVLAALDDPRKTYVFASRFTRGVENCERG